MEISLSFENSTAARRLASRLEVELLHVNFVDSNPVPIDGDDPALLAAIFA
jgi:hypothetical protein